MEYYRSEIKTGIMVITCVFILVLATFYVGGSKMWGTTYNLNVVYKNVGGLEQDAPVYYSGLEVGMVKNIRVMTKAEKEKFPDCTILVNIMLDKLAQVKKDSKILIKTLGFMGLRYIDITPGSDIAETIPPSTTVKGDTAQDINEVMESVGEIVDQIKPKAGSIVKGMDNIIGENGSLQTTITDLKKLINDADEIIVVNKEDINKIIANLSVATEHLKEFAKNIEEHPWKLLIKTPEKKPSAPIKPLEGRKEGEKTSFQPASFQPRKRAK